MGVDLFFVLTGFPTSGLLFAELSNAGHLRVGRFLLRRGFNIYPSFYAFLAFSLVFYDRNGLAALTEAVFLQDCPALTGAEAWYQTRPLAVEEHVYVALPLLLLLPRETKLLNSQGIFAVFGVAALACVALRAFDGARHPHVTFATRHEATHLRIDSLLFGIVVSCLHHAHRLATQWFVRRRRRALAIVAAALVCPTFLIPPETAWMPVLTLPGLRRPGFVLVLISILAGRLATRVVELPMLALRERLVPRNRGPAHRLGADVAVGEH
jgi:peptidoglycan/LPS O-acetylase OafA/YrhL